METAIRELLKSQPVEFWWVFFGMWLLVIIFGIVAYRFWQI